MFGHELPDTRLKRLDDDPDLRTKLFVMFLGNAAMGLIFGYLYRRWGRVTPMIIAHTLIDAVTFVGYAALHGHVSWLP